jgi:hypothetical protein
VGNARASINFDDFPYRPGSNDRIVETLSLEDGNSQDIDFRTMGQILAVSSGPQRNKPR